MSLISKAITHLFGGVSQQPASLRDASQCDLMENCWPNVAEGLGKRPPVLHVAKLNSDTAANRKVHLINRDEGEKYAVTLKSGEVKVYDRVTGTEKSVAVPDGISYLTSADPLSDFSLVTVADTTFVVNKSIDGGGCALTCQHFPRSSHYSKRNLTTKPLGSYSTAAPLISGSGLVCQPSRRTRAVHRLVP
jgi:hypothetical protein